MTQYLVPPYEEGWFFVAFGDGSSSPPAAARRAREAGLSIQRIHGPVPGLLAETGGVCVRDEWVAYRPPTKYAWKYTGFP